MSAENMNLIFKIFDPCILGHYPTYDPEVVEQANRILNTMRINKPIEPEMKTDAATDLLIRAFIRTKIKLDHFVKRTRGLNIQPDTHAPKDVVDHIIYSIMVNDSATNVPYDMFFVENQNPSVVAAALREAIVVVEKYVKILDIENK